MERRKGWKVAALLGVALWGASTCAFAQGVGLAKTPYAKFRGDAQNTGRGEGKGAKGNVAWSIETGGEIPSSAAIGGDGTIYFVSNNHKFYALDKAGKGWTLETETFNGSSSTPGQAPAIGADGTIYVGDPGGYDDNNRGRLVAIDPKEKKIKWAYKAKAAVYSSPAIGGDGTIYFGSQDGFLYAVTPEGEGKWKFDTGGQVRASPAIGKDGTVYIGSHSLNFYALDGKTGKEKWSFAAAGIHIEGSAAIGDDGTIYFGSSGSMTKGPSTLYALDPAGKKKWSVENCTGSSSPGIGRDGTVFTQGESGDFLALDGQTGKEKWKVNLAIPQGSSPAIGGDGTVYVTAGNRLFALNPETGGEKWNVPTDRSLYASPAIGDDGTIYFGSGDQKFYAVK